MFNENAVPQLHNPILKQAKERFFQYKKTADRGKPTWNFLRDKWPYGNVYLNARASTKFADALIEDTGARSYNVSLNETLMKMGFCKEDLGHVLQTFELGFHTLLASHESSIQQGLKAIDHVIEANFVIDQRLNPPSDFFVSLYEKWNLDTDDYFEETSTNHFAQASMDQHKTLTGVAKRAVWKQLLGMANDIWLKERLVSASTAQGSMGDFEGQMPSSCGILCPSTSLEAQRCGIRTYLSVLHWIDGMRKGASCRTCTSSCLGDLQLKVETLSDGSDPK
ncbi:uncharacterized protein UDID_18556 [Ustilago sp. UG-2017a]|nr:uncharacterized protein UDID_18556 [Ustilago sp. UG-2017a]